VLVDLRDLAARKGGIDNFENRLEQLCTGHAKKISLIERLNGHDCYGNRRTRRRRLAVSETLWCNGEYSRARCGGTS
jgi:hypothetical protein